MKPLIVLFTTFAIALFATKIFQDDWNFIFAGHAAMSAMPLFTAVGHFVFSKGMAMMMPGFIPFKTGYTYFKIHDALL